MSDTMLTIDRVYDLLGLRWESEVIRTASALSDEEYKETMKLLVAKPVAMAAKAVEESYVGLGWLAAYGLKCARSDECRDWRIPEGARRP